MSGDARRQVGAEGRWRWLTRATLTVVTPLAEKNPVKAVGTRSLDVPIVLSMGRVIVLAFAVAMVRQVWLAGVAGWPDATLAIAVVLAMPILGAMERAKPGEVLDLAKTLINRFGVGEARQIGSVYTVEPSKYDDHRDDSRDDGRDDPVPVRR